MIVEDENKDYELIYYLNCIYKCSYCYYNEQCPYSGQYGGIFEGD